MSNTMLQFKETISEINKTSMTTGFRVVGNIERIAEELKEQNK